MAQMDEIEAAVQAFLARFSPPRAIADNPQAMGDEALGIAKAVARHAPRTGFAEWWVEVGSEVVLRMKHRAWPMVSEVETACRAVRDRHMGTSGIAMDAIEEAAVDRLESWYRKFGDQMPGQGRHDRTMALIRRGTIKDIREAKFKGFDLSPAAMRAAMDMPMVEAEARHHNDVMDRLRAIQSSMAWHRDEAAKKRRIVQPQTGNATEDFSA